MAVRLLVCLRLVNLTATKLKAFQERSPGTFMPFEGDLKGHSGCLLPDDRLEKPSAYLPVPMDREGLSLLCASCGEPMFENAGSQHSLLEDREACAMESDQSPDALAYRQNPMAHPDYVNQVFLTRIDASSAKAGSK